MYYFFIKIIDNIQKLKSLNTDLYIHISAFLQFFECSHKKCNNKLLLNLIRSKLNIYFFFLRNETNL